MQGRKKTGGANRRGGKKTLRLVSLHLEEEAYNSHRMSAWGGSVRKKEGGREREGERERETKGFFKRERGEEKGDRKREETVFSKEKGEEKRNENNRNEKKK